MKLVYQIDTEGSLNYVLALVYEIRAEMGISPE